jgi:hypothetical protein
VSAPDGGAGEVGSLNRRLTEEFIVHSRLDAFNGSGIEELPSFELKLKAPSHVRVKRLLAAHV